MKRSIFTLILFLLLLSGTAAQPTLNFKRLMVNWPTVELYFSVWCNGNANYTMAKQDFKIFENGAEVKDFTLFCPDPSIRCAISLALVFDASGSMSGSGNAGAKLAGHAFIDMMDGVIDEATIIFFSGAGQVWIEQQMTTVKPMLHAAMDNLPVLGMTAVWDGIYAGLVEVINTGVNQCRAVIALTDGGDNQSTRTVAEIISLANRHRIRVFTVGLGSGINATELEQIALLTGGRYYQTPNAGQLAAVYQEISTILFQSFQECMITYQRDCADVGMRTVELQLRDFCSGSDVKTKTYRAPLDSTSFSNLRMKLGSVTGRSGREMKVPLELLTSINKKMFYPLTFTLLFDPQCVELRNVAAPPGSLLEGMPITVTPVPGGVSIAVTDGRVLDGKGRLMEFSFQTTDPLDTTCCELRGIDAKFEQGCFIPIIDPGETCILPRATIVTCDITAPKALLWQRGILEYTPYPFPVTMRIYNTGDREATNVRYKIDYDTSDVRLVSPTSDVQPGTPRNLPAGESSEVLWQLAAKRRTSGDSAQFCITASFDNHEDVTCCVKVYIPPTEPILECAIDAPSIVVDSTHTRYVPMPFPLTISVTNTGGLQTDSITATISFSPDLTLTAGEQGSKRLLPSKLSSNQQGQTQWLLQHPMTTTEKQYVIRVWVKAANTDSILCEKTLIIPEIGGKITPDISASGALTFCDGGEVTLDAGSGYTAYKWSTGDTTQTLIIRQSGTYSVTVWDVWGRSGTSAPITVTVFPLPPKPVITRSGDVLLADNASAWQWFKSGSPIPGATDQFLILAESGAYSVKVTNSDGCEQFSDEFIVSVLGIESPVLPEWNISVYPEPNTGFVTLQWNTTTRISGSVDLYDLAGRVVLGGIPIEGEGLFSSVVDVSQLQPGTYLLRIIANGSQQYVKIRRL